tara:strand:- start:531 stop:695 length:165 start_codon:yes stop_codon:yes gene_type:complete
MSPKADKYLAEPSPKLWAKMTSEERRFVESNGGHGPGGKRKPAANDNAPKKPSK